MIVLLVALTWVALVCAALWFFHAAAKVSGEPRTFQGQLDSSITQEK